MNLVQVSTSGRLELSSILEALETFHEKTAGEVNVKHKKDLEPFSISINNRRS